jgi:8-oxo-dGTP pyrophosphatase MutT (NUDIX family)
VLVVNEDRVLMVQHVRSGRYRWELPSGLVDAGETFEQAAERESIEETGVAVSIMRLLCVAAMEVSGAAYHGVNLYYRAEALNHVTPHPSAKKSGSLLLPTSPPRNSRARRKCLGDESTAMLRLMQVLNR